MNKTVCKRLVGVLLCLLTLFVCMAGCGGETPAPSAPGANLVNPGEATDVGKGATSFPFTVVDIGGGEVHYTVHTDKETVGEALQELGLITGEDGPYGLYVKAVNGFALDYAKDGAYWSFYIDGQYAATGVDKTPIKAGEVYSFCAEFASK